MQSLGFGLPVVEASCDANGDGRWMSELEANWHQLGASGFAVIMVFVVFHSCEFNWFLRQNSFTEHFCDDEDQNGSDKAAATEEIDQGVPSGGKQGCY
jgi:hypothetical protein